MLVIRKGLFRIWYSVTDGASSVAEFHGNTLKFRGEEYKIEDTNFHRGFSESSVTVHQLTDQLGNVGDEETRSRIRDQIIAKLHNQNKDHWVVSGWPILAYSNSDGICVEFEGRSYTLKLKRSGFWNKKMNSIILEGDQERGSIRETESPDSFMAQYGPEFPKGTIFVASFATEIPIEVQLFTLWYVVRIWTFNDMSKGGGW